LVDKPIIDIVVGRTLGLGLGKGKGGMSEKQIYLVAYKGETDILSSLQRKLGDDV
jgi:hypothetical protein